MSKYKRALLILFTTSVTLLIVTIAVYDTMLGDWATAFIDSIAVGISLYGSFLALRYS